MDIELMNLIHSFRNTITLNNLLIKNKILRKLELIYIMQLYGFPLMKFPQSISNKIIQKLQCIDKEGDIVKYYNATNESNTNKLLGNILHNALQASNYNVILSNAPIYGNTIDNDTILLDAQSIFETLIQYISDNTVKMVCQIAPDTYLIKIDTNEHAMSLCNLLHEKLLGGNIIKVEYIEPLTNQNEIVKNTLNIDRITHSSNDVIIKQCMFSWILDIIHKLTNYLNKKIF